MEIDTVTGEIKAQLGHVAIFPASHYVVPKEKMLEATEHILEELKERVAYFKKRRQAFRGTAYFGTHQFDVEMMRETGFCSGIENYSRHFNRSGTRRTALYTDRLFPGRFPYYCR